MKLKLTVIIFINTCGSIYSQTIRPIPKNAISPHDELVIPSNKTTRIIVKDSFASNGFFSWIVTGDPSVDGANIQAASEKFRFENPEIYAKISRDSSNITYVSYVDFMGMSEVKQKYILNNLNLFILERKIIEYLNLKVK